uniref:Uncharacterized protein n=1 Tax=Setaria italica TaxID=4555 RepID=K3ZPF3_SETIT
MGLVLGPYIDQPGSHLTLITTPGFASLDYIKKKSMYLPGRLYLMLSLSAYQVSPLPIKRQGAKQ